MFITFKNITEDIWEEMDSTKRLTISVEEFVYIKSKHEILLKKLKRIQGLIRESNEKPNSFK